jgi:multidrug transporter EmrE-like cation transporter
MNIFTFNLVLSGVLLNAGAQLFLKAGTNSIGIIIFNQSNWLPLSWRIASEPHILAGVACYIVSLIIWIMALSRIEVSVAYPMLSIGYIINALAAWYLFGESLTLERMAGIGLIVAGVYLVTRS